MVLQIALVLLIFTFFFLTYMVTKSWRALHVVCLVAVFFNAIAFLFFAGFTLKTQEAWRTIVNKQEDEVEAVTTKAYELQYGEDGDTQQLSSSLLNARAELERVVIDRGRVWRDCVPQSVNFDQQTGLIQATLTIPPRETAAAAPPPAAGDDPEAAPAAPAPVAGVRHLMQEKIILFAFLELPSDPDDPTSYNVPVYYMGEYFASNVTPTSVTLRSVVPPGEAEVKAAQSTAQGNQGTWALYEVMPTDGHAYFADMEEQTLRGYLSPQLTGLATGEITQTTYDTMIQEYLRDGQPAADDDPPERKWVKVEFVRNHPISVDAAEPEILTTENFDSQGKATNIQLQQGDDTEFEIGDTVYMDYATATELERQGMVKKIEEIYVRELRDYEYSFHNIYRRMVELDQSLRNTARDQENADETIADMRKQIAYREQEKTGLNKDLTNLTDEAEKIEAYLAELTKYRTALGGKLSSLYQNTNALETQLSEMQSALEEEIEDRASRAVAEVGTGAPSQ